jgi:hypothetical protein
LGLVLVYALWNLSGTSIATMKKLESARIFSILLVVEAIDIFEIAVEREEELCPAVNSMVQCVIWALLARKIWILARLRGFGSMLDELLEALVVDILRRPLGY